MIVGFNKRLVEPQVLHNSPNSSQKNSVAQQKHTESNTSNEPKNGSQNNTAVEQKLSNEIEGLREKVSNLSDNLVMLHNQVQLLAHALEAGKEQFVETEAVSSVSDSVSEPSNLSDISDRYNSELRDESWALLAEKSIVDEFSYNQNVDGVFIETVDCRNSLCHVSWQYPDDITNENAFILENELLFAMEKAGFNSSSQKSIGGKLMEGYFWYQAPQKGAEPELRVD